LTTYAGPIPYFLITAQQLLKFLNGNLFSKYLDVNSESAKYRLALLRNVLMLE